MKTAEYEMLDTPMALPHVLTVRQKGYRVIKAGIDFVAALLALIVLLPVFLIVAIAIKLDSRGPVFFLQKRIGKGGKLFRCVKFRTMTTDANHDVAGYEYAEVTSYITRVGRVLRKLSIDELPQLFNVLTFRMSWIGYRPSQPCEDELNTAREARMSICLSPVSRAGHRSTAATFWPRTRPKRPSSMPITSSTSRCSSISRSCF